MGTIRSQIDQNMYHHVVKESRADVLWRKLKTIYEQPTTQNKVNLIKKLVNLKYKEGRSITEHTNEFQSLIDQLIIIKMILDDELQVLLLLSYLLDSWKTLVVSVNNSVPNNKLTLDMVTDRLRNEEFRRKMLKQFPLSQKISHIKREYRLQKTKHAKEKDDAQKHDKENIAIIVDGDLGIVYDECLVNLNCHTSDWVINLGASFHVIAHRDYFTSYVNGDYGHVRMENEGASKIVRIGDICLKTSIDFKLLLKDVRNV